MGRTATDAMADIVVGYTDRIAELEDRIAELEDRERKILEAAKKLRLGHEHNWFRSVMWELTDDTYWKGHYAHEGL
jgi:hypothetical protein